MIAHALTNAREALGRKLADTATQGRLLQAMVTDAQPAASAETHRGLRTTAISRAPTRSAP
jgi:hypothetical protein